MILFSQNQKGTSLNPISITNGSPSPSNLKSSARGPETELEAAKDDMNDALFDLHDYADAALEVAETELDGGGSNVNLKDYLEENEGLFGLVDGCFQDGRSSDDIGKEFGLVGLGEKPKRIEQGLDTSALFERTEHSNLMSREEPITSALMPQGTEEMGRSLIPKWRKPAWSGPKSINEYFSLELSRSWAFLDKSRAKKDG